MKGFFTKTKIFLISTLVMISSIYHYSQDSSKIIMLSRDIGPIVDLDEKLEYNILPKYRENFVSAMFYFSADSLYHCKVRLRNDNTVTDTILTLNYNSIRNTAMRVQYLESIKKSNSSFNMQNVELIYANNEEVKNIVKMEERSVKTSNEINARSYEFTFVTELPLSKQNIDYSQLVESDNYFGASFGVFYNSTKFNEFSEIFNLLEENIPADGYEITKSDLSFNSFPIFSLSSFLIISKNFMIEFKYGFNLKTGTQHYLSYTTFISSLGYLQPVFKNTKLYGAIGFTGLDFDAFNNYGVIINENSGLLESIKLNGKAKGIKVSLGVKYNLSPSFIIDLIASQNFYSDLEIINYEGYQIPNIPKININGFDIGVGFSVTNN